MYVGARFIRRKEPDIEAAGPARASIAANRAAEGLPFHVTWNSQTPRSTATRIMHVTYLGRAGFIAETDDVIVIMDPWV
jgi:hypothetical protein